MRITILALIVVAVGVTIVLAQYEAREVTFWVYRDQESLTMVFRGNGEVFFHSIRVEAVTAEQRRNEINLEDRYSTFRTLNVIPLELPTCLRVEWQETQLPFPDDCIGMTGNQLKIENNVGRSGIFWYRRDIREYLPLIFFQGDMQIGECDGGGTSILDTPCEITFTPAPMPIVPTVLPRLTDTYESQQPTDTAMQTSISFALATATAQSSSFSETNTTWEPIIVQDFGANSHNMVIVPAPPDGTVRIGSTDFPNSPEAEVELLISYMIDRYEVSRGQYASCLSQGGCSEYPNSTIDPDINADPTLPRTGISPTGANQYCRWALGLGGRLPNEYEWEYAAAGPDGWDYPWGDETSDIQSRAVFAGNSGGNPVSVEQPRNDQSWVGARYMSGNVREIAGDEGVYVGRGGDYNVSLAFIRTQFRPLPEYFDLDLDVTGFRCVVPLNG